ncbi:MAG TPA: helix-turn-helix domain-containing protein [Usitatibacter sp.]|nr:helix-turn-helix domain-containing protein [Usitatibacter sp.]
MSAVHLVRDPRQAALLAAPIRQRILEALEEPASASALADKLGLSRQLVAYHSRQLEAHGYVELVREERRRGCTERILKRTARYLVASNAMFGRAGLDPARMRDKFSADYLLALAERMTREVGAAQAAAQGKGMRLPTLSSDVEIRFRAPAEREAFAQELVEAIARLAAKYHDESCPGGRSYRLVMGAYPIRRSHERKAKAG